MRNEYSSSYMGALRSLEMKNSHEWNGIAVHKTNDTFFSPSITEVIWITLQKKLFSMMMFVREHTSIAQWWWIIDFLDFSLRKKKN